MRNRRLHYRICPYDRGKWHRHILAIFPEHFSHMLLRPHQATKGILIVNHDSITSPFTQSLSRSVTVVWRLQYIFPIPFVEHKGRKLVDIYLISFHYVFLARPVFTILGLIGFASPSSQIRGNVFPHMANWSRYL
jgi:hypothetical protein